MAKKAVFNYKAYLKIIGAISIAIGIVGVITAILIPVAKIDVNQLGLSEAQLADFRKIEGTTDDVIRVSMAIVASIASLWAIFEGWLMRRAAKNPEKSTLLLVLLVISVISGIAGVFTYGGTANTISEIVQLVLNVLALMAVVQIRKEVSE